MPIIAVAPLLTIWVRSVFWSRVLVAVLVVFFPILINVIAGLRSVPRELYDVMRRAARHALGAVSQAGAAGGAAHAAGGPEGRRHALGHRRASSANLCSPESIGLGFLINTARYQFKTDLVFVVLITLALHCRCSLYGLVALRSAGCCAGSRRRLSESPAVDIRLDLVRAAALLFLYS